MINKLKNDIKESLIQKDNVRKDALRNVINKANLDAKEKKVDISNEILVSAITKEVKQLDQTINILVENNKTDTELYVTSTKQKEVLTAYLPKALSEDELRTEISKIIASTENKKLIIKNVMAALKGKADGSIINKITKELTI